VEDDIGRRLFSRQTVKITAKCGISSKLMPVQITDLSAGGCRIRFQDVHLGMGQRVMLIIPGACADLTGIIRWRDSENAGIEFETIINQNFLKHIRMADSRGVG
jgi:hypothetical protein